MPKGTITTASPAALCGFIRTDRGEDIMIPARTLRTSPIKFKPGDKVTFDIVIPRQCGTIPAYAGEITQVRGGTFASNIRLIDDKGRAA